MNIAVYINTKIENFAYLQQQIATLLNRHNLQYQFITKNALTNWADILIVVGGDGSIIKMAKLAALQGVKVLPINAGNMGFLAEFESNELDDAIAFLKAGKYIYDERPLLKCKIDQKSYYAINEFAVHTNFSHNAKQCTISGSKVLRANVYLNDSLATNIVASGMLVGTSTGSTAYSLSAGGAIVLPDLSAFIFTPIVANSLTSRPIVYNDSCNLNIKLQEKSASAILLCDGDNVCNLPEQASLTIYKATHTILFIRKRKNNFFENYRKRVKN